RSSGRRNVIASACFGAATIATGAEPDTGATAAISVDRSSYIASESTVKADAVVPLIPFRRPGGRVPSPATLSSNAESGCAATALDRPSRTIAWMIGVECWKMSLENGTIIANFLGANNKAAVVGCITGIGAASVTKPACEAAAVIEFTAI